MMPIKALRLRKAGASSSFSKVALLMGFEGADGSTAIVDESSHARTVTVVGNAQIDTAVALIGTSSLLLDGTGDYVEVPASANLALLTKSFCFEGFFRFVALGDRALASQWGASNTWIVDYNAGTLRSVFNVGGSNFITNRTWTPSTGVRYHVAVSRDGTNLRMFIDGVQQGATASIGAGSIANAVGPLQVGVINSGTNAFNGWMDEIRFTIDDPVYTANFTPPTGPFPRS